ncbi:MAG: indole-3-glycerol phosphate synthase TrpC [Pirellulales bacterium]|nr:indole-3-glycerol phosphate synthase TrpC [Pirellulales bacterium]
MDILAEIVAHKRAEVAAARAQTPLVQIQAGLADAPPVRNFFQPLAQPGGIKLIAEVKRASPSAGLIRPDLDPVAIARVYESAGASCLSVLTDARYFQGSLEDLTAVKRGVALPVLRKDFIIDPYQVYEARAAGADAVLLIAECLDDCDLRSLHNLIVDLGMTPLVEIYDAENLQRVFDAGATLIGVNNRNLRTMVTDLGHALRLRPRVPDQCVFVAESGIKTRADVEQLIAARVDAMLVGESLLRQPDLAAAVRGLLESG